LKGWTLEVGGIIFLFNRNHPVPGCIQGACDTCMLIADCVMYDFPPHSLRLPSGGRRIDSKTKNVRPCARTDCCRGSFAMQRSSHIQ